MDVKTGGPFSPNPGWVIPAPAPAASAAAEATAAAGSAGAFSGTTAASRAAAGCCLASCPMQDQKIKELALLLMHETGANTATTLIKASASGEDVEPIFPRELIRLIGEYSFPANLTLLELIRMFSLRNIQLISPTLHAAIQAGVRRGTIKDYIAFASEIRGLLKSGQKEAKEEARRLIHTFFAFAEGLDLRKFFLGFISKPLPTAHVGFPCFGWEDGSIEVWDHANGRRFYSYTCEEVANNWWVGEPLLFVDDAGSTRPQDVQFYCDLIDCIPGDTVDLSYHFSTLHPMTPAIFQAVAAKPEVRHFVCVNGWFTEPARVAAALAKSTLTTVSFLPHTRSDAVTVPSDEVGETLTSQGLDQVYQALAGCMNRLRVLYLRDRLFLSDPGLTAEQLERHIRGNPMVQRVAISTDCKISGAQLQGMRDNGVDPKIGGRPVLIERVAFS